MKQSNTSHYFTDVVCFLFSVRILKNLPMKCPSSMGRKVYGEHNLKRQTKIYIIVVTVNTISHNLLNYKILLLLPNVYSNTQFF